MEELKEQIAGLCSQGMKNCDYRCSKCMGLNFILKHFKDWFKQEMGELGVIGDEEIRKAKDEGWKFYISCANRRDFTEDVKKELRECEQDAIAQAQLAYNQKQLLEKIEPKVME